MEAPQDLKTGNLGILVEMGTRGYFPILTSEWINQVSKEPRKLNLKEKKKAKTITQRLLQHRSFERQKTVLLTLSEEDRKLFIQSFFKMVEGKVLDGSPELH